MLDLGFAAWDLFVDGKPMDSFVDEVRKCGENAFIRQLQTGGEHGDHNIMSLGEVRDFILRLNARQFDCDMPAFSCGIAGLPTLSVLKRICFGDHLGNQEKFSGRIRDYIYVAETQSGFLCVDVIVDQTGFAPVGQDHRAYFHWVVQIDAGTFREIRRVDLDCPFDVDDPMAYPKKPFGDGLTLPEEAVDPANCRSIWRRNLTYKLHAEGEGIKVLHVYHRKLSEAKLTRLPDAHPCYQPSKDSCIDLFTEGKPPATFAELTTKAFCLGRCANPAIYNTGE